MKIQEQTRSRWPSHRRINHDVLIVYPVGCTLLNFMTTSASNSRLTSWLLSETQDLLRAVKVRIRLYRTCTVILDQHCTIERRCYRHKLELSLKVLNTPGAAPCYRISIWVRIHLPFLRTFFVFFCSFFLYLETFECNTTSDCRSRMV